MGELREGAADVLAHHVRLTQAGVGGEGAQHRGFDLGDADVEGAFTALFSHGGGSVMQNASRARRGMTVLGGVAGVGGRRRGAMRESASPLTLRRTILALRSLLTPTFALALLLAGCSGEPSGRGEGPLGSNGGNGAGGSGSGAGPAEGSGGGLIPVPDEDEPQNEDCGTVLPVVYRDFTEAHPDFEMQFSGDEVRLQLVEATLGPDSKPVFRDSVGCPWGINEDPPTPRECDPYWSPDIPVITSAETFDQWYRDVEGVNQTFVKELEDRKSVV